MNQYVVVTDAIELISGTKNRTSPVYVEAAKDIGSSNNKSLRYLKNFITSIENIAAKEGVNDESITASRGNIKSFKGYENIKTCISFLSQNLSNSSVIKDLTSLFHSLELYQPEYSEAYEQQVRIIVLEYESALWMLVTGLSFAMANNIDIKSTANKIIVGNKPANDKGIITSTTSKMAKELSSKDHKEYLNAVIKMKDESPVQESAEPYLEGSLAAVSDTMTLISNFYKGIAGIGNFAKSTFDKLKRTWFGIFPLIRTIMYLKYKKKADSILALEQQAHFIELNISHLKNMTTMDPVKKQEIIRRQEAQVEAYRKKAEKYRAQLVETEKETAVAIQDDNPMITDTSVHLSTNTDDDFSLE